MNSRRPKRDLEATVYRAVRSLGWLPPQTEEEVEAAENADDESVDLPTSLLDPSNVFRTDRCWGRRSSATMPPADVVEELARAARQQDGAVSPAAEAQMRRDREAAERAADDASDDE